MPMLNGRLELHGTDAEALCTRVLQSWCRRTRTELVPQDREDALSYLIACCWEIAEFKYDPARGVRFDSYAYGILSFRVTDWLRQDEKRTRWQFATHTYERTKPTVLSLDAPARDHDPAGDPLGATLPDRNSNSTADPDPDDSARLLAESRRHARRDHRVLRQAATQRAPRRAA